MKKAQILLALVLLILPSTIFCQKNSLGIYSNYTTHDYLTQTSDFGVRYSRTITPKIQIGIGFDRQKNYNLNSFQQSFNAYSLATGTLLFSKTLTYAYKGKVNIGNIDFFVSYNLLKATSKFSISPIVGLSTQIIKYTHVPLVETVDYEIVNAKEVKGTKTFLSPRFGLNSSYTFKNNISIGIDLFYRNVIDTKGKIIFTNRTTNKENGITFYDDKGTPYESNPGSGSSIRDVELGSQLGIGFNVMYRF